MEAESRTVWTLLTLVPIKHKDKSIIRIEAINFLKNIIEHHFLMLSPCLSMHLLHPDALSKKMFSAEQQIIDLSSYNYTYITPYY